MFQVIEEKVEEAVDGPTEEGCPGSEEAEEAPTDEASAT